MNAGLGVGPNASNMPPGIKAGRIASPVNILKFVIIFFVMLSAAYGLLIDTNAILMSCLIIQFLFVALLVVMAIQIIKEDAKVRRILRRLAYTYLLVALISLMLGVISFLEISKYWW